MCAFDTDGPYQLGRHCELRRGGQLLDSPASRVGHLSSYWLRSELLEGVVFDNVALVIGYDFVEGDLS